MDSELIMQNGEITGTKFPTGHKCLLDARFELPYGKNMSVYLSNTEQLMMNINESESASKMCLKIFTPCRYFQLFKQIVFSFLAKIPSMKYALLIHRNK